MKVEKKFFAYISGEGFEWFATPKEAKDRARELLQNELQWAVRNGEWSDVVHTIKWGQVKGAIGGYSPHEEEVDLKLEDVK